MSGSDSTGHGQQASSAAAAKVSIDVPIGHQTNCLIGLTMNTKRPAVSARSLAGSFRPMLISMLALSARRRRVVDILSGVHI